jgi:Cell division protein CrgA
MVMQAKDTETTAPHRASPAWFGAIAASALLAATIWLLMYTLLDWDWQQQMGAWNYLISALLSTVFTQMLRFWHGTPVQT